MDIIRRSYYIHGPWGDKINFCCFICVTQRCALNVVIKRQFFYIYICSFSTSICLWDTNTLVLKTNGRHFAIHFQVSILMLSSSSACRSASAYQTLYKYFNLRRSYDVIKIFKMADAASQIYFRFGFGNNTHLRTYKPISTPNFGDLCQSVAEILLLPVSEKKRPPYWNSISGFDFDVFIVIGMLFCISIPNFVQIGQSAPEIWRHNEFQDGGRDVANLLPVSDLSLIHIWRCRRSTLCRSRWSPYH